MHDQPRPRTSSVLAATAIVTLMIASGIAVVSGADVARYVPLLLLALTGFAAILVVDAARRHDTSTSA